MTEHFRFMQHESMVHSIDITTGKFDTSVILLVSFLLKWNFNAASDIDAIGNAISVTSV